MEIKKYFWSIAIIITPIILIMWGVFVMPVYALSVPHYLSFEGQLTDSSNTLLTNTYNMTFRIYKSLTGGSAVWSETHSGVSVSNGYFSVSLGNSTALDLNFDEPYWISIEVSSDGEMSPRTPINSVGYAYASDVAFAAYSSSTAPLSPSGGDLYYDTDDDALYLYNGVTWTDLASIGSGTSTQMTISDYLWIGDDDTDNLDIRAGVWDFTSTATTTVAMTNGLNFDSNLFVIDPNSNRVSVGTSTPAAKFSVVGGGTALENLVLSRGFSSNLTGAIGFFGYTNVSGGLSTGGSDSIKNALRITNTGNLKNIGSIQAGEALFTSAGTFGSSASYTTGSGPQDVSIVDVNGDGYTDLVIGNGSATTVSVLINDGDGTFAAKVDYTTSATNQRIATGDLNGDGYVDIVAAHNTAATVSVLLNNGDGTFATSVDYAIASSNGHPAIGDVNGDGKADLVVGNSGGVSVLLNNGDGTFGTYVTYATGGAGGLSIADLDGDGYADIASAGSTAVDVLINNGNGTFASEVNYTAGSSPNRVVVADFNNDNYPDIATTNGGSNTLSVFINDGDGTFAAKVDYGTGTIPFGLAVGDVSGDGYPDLATANLTNTNASVFINNGDGTFATRVNYSAGTSPYGIALGDVDNDGKADLVVANNGSSNAYVYLNTKTTLLYAKASTGNVGIATTTAAYKLVINSSSSTENLFQIATTTNQNILTVNSAGNVSLSKILTLTVSTTNSNTGIIYKGSERFIHNFSHPTGSSAIPDGYNTFVGLSAGNFTMGSAATSVLHGSRNTGIGYQTLISNTLGFYNSSLGSQALYSNTEGKRNVAIGSLSLNLNTTGFDNVAVGQQVLYNNLTGNYNSAVGNFALTSSLSSTNTAFGYEAGQYLANGSSFNTLSNTSVYIGAATKSSLAGGVSNENVFGYNATGLGSNTVVLGDDNILTTGLKGKVGIATTTPAFKLTINSSSSTENLFQISTTTNQNILTVNSAGNVSLSKILTLTSSTTDSNTGIIYKGSDGFIHNFSHPTGSSAIPEGQNTFVGLQAGNFTMGSTATVVSAGSYNTGIGYQVLKSNTVGEQNTALGTKALTVNTTGGNNVAIGNSSLVSNTTGNGNSSVGSTALSVNVDGDYNSAFGEATLSSNISGNNNSGFGNGSLTFTTGNNNTAIGYHSLFWGTAVSSNTALGYGAGEFIANGTDANQLSSTSLYIGAGTKALLSGSYNENVIGYDAIGLGSNTVVLGNDNILTTGLKGKVGIATTTPAFKLVINSSNATDKLLQIATSTNQGIMTVNENGLVSMSSLLGEGNTYVCTDNNGLLSVRTDDTCTNSSIRFKENVEDYIFDQNAFLQNNVVSFDWKVNGEHDISMIAEEVFENNPELVFFNANGEVEGIKANDIMWYTFEVVKAQQARLDNLESTVSSLVLNGNSETITSESLEAQLYGLKVEFEGDILVKGHATFSEDTVGQAKILAGDTRVEVQFESAYENMPIVSVSKLSPIVGDYWLSDVTEEHFYIELIYPQDHDILFNWNAFGANDAKIFSSDGTVEDILQIENTLITIDELEEVDLVTTSSIEEVVELDSTTTTEDGIE